MVQALMIMHHDRIETCMLPCPHVKQQDRRQMCDFQAPSVLSAKNRCVFFDLGLSWLNLSLLWVECHLSLFMSA